jgi:hypothetical protein
MGRLAPVEKLRSRHLGQARIAYARKTASRRSERHVDATYRE